jgi:glutathione S-transferase
MALALNEYGAEAEMREEEPWAPSADLYRLNTGGTLPVIVEDDGKRRQRVEALGEYLGGDP